MNVDLIDGNVFDPQGGTGRAIGLTASHTAHLNFNVNRNEKIYGSGGAGHQRRRSQRRGDLGTHQRQPRCPGRRRRHRLGPVIHLEANGNSTQTVEVIGNTIAGSGNDPAIVAGSRGDLVSAFTAALDVTIRNNTIALSGTGVPSVGAAGIATFAGANAADVTRTCVSLQDNAVTLAVPAVDIAWHLQNAGTSNLYVEGWDTSANSTWNGRGNTPLNSTSAVLDPGAPAIAAPPGGTCLTPSAHDRAAERRAVAGLGVGCRCGRTRRAGQRAGHQPGRAPESRRARLIGGVGAAPARDADAAHPARRRLVGRA